MSGTNANANNFQGGTCIVQGLAGCKCSGRSCKVDLDRLEEGYPVCGDGCLEVAMKLCEGDNLQLEMIQVHARTSYELCSSKKSADAVSAIQKERERLRQNLRMKQQAEIEEQRLVMQRLNDEHQLQLEAQLARNKKLKVLSDAMRCNRTKPDVYEALKAAETAIRLNQAMHEDFAVLPRGGAALTYTSSVVEAFLSAPGSKGVQPEADHKAKPSFQQSWYSFSSGTTTPRLAIMPPPGPVSSHNEEQISTTTPLLPRLVLPPTSGSNRGESDQTQPARGSYDQENEEPVTYSLAKKFDAEKYGGECKESFFRSAKTGLKNVPTKNLTPDGIMRIAGQFRTKAMQGKELPSNAPKEDATAQCWEDWVRDEQHTGPTELVYRNDCTTDAWDSMLGRLWALRKEAELNKQNRKRKAEKAGGREKKVTYSSVGSSSSSSAAAAAAAGGGPTTLDNAGASPTAASQDGVVQIAGVACDDAGASADVAATDAGTVAGDCGQAQGDVLGEALAAENRHSFIVGPTCRQGA